MAEAIDPNHGLPSLHDFPPTLAQVKKFLEPRYLNYTRLQELKAVRDRKRLPEPARDPQVEHRIVEGFKKLSLRLGAQK